MKILILNGPNLNMLGKREPGIYGTTSFDDYLKKLSGRYIADIDYFQSNHEGDLIDKIHQADGNYDGIVLNAGAYTHTSIAIHDAILSVNVPVIEVHISNIAKREEFRKTSYISSAAVGTIMGFGLYGYDMAINWLIEENSKKENNG